jgi:hypothetical protein
MPFAVKSSSSVKSDWFDRRDRLRDGLKAAYALQDASEVTIGGTSCLVLGTHVFSDWPGSHLISAFMIKDVIPDQIALLVNAFHSKQQQVIVDILALTSPWDDISIAMDKGATGVDVAAVVGRHSISGHRVQIEIFGVHIFNPDCWSLVQPFIERWVTSE